MFAANGTLLFDDDDETGFFGDVILVNGGPWPNMKVERRKYRFRVLNACDLALVPAQARAPASRSRSSRTDGGLMPTPQSTGDLLDRHGRALRDHHRLREVHGRPARSTLLNAARQEQHGLRPHRQGHGVRGRQGRHTTVEQHGAGRPRHRPPGHGASRPSDAKKTRSCASSATGTHERLWTIDGKTWEDVVDSELRARSSPTPSRTTSRSGSSTTRRAAGSTRCTSTSSTSRSSSRNGRPPQPYENGPKDVVYVGESETVACSCSFEHAATAAT